MKRNATNLIKIISAFLVFSMLSSNVVLSVVASTDAANADSSSSSARSNDSESGVKILVKDDAYAEYDSNSKTLTMGTDSVKRVVTINSAGQVGTIHNIDVSAGVDYVNQDDIQNEFSLLINGALYSGLNPGIGKKWNYVSSKSYRDTQNELVFNLVVSNGIVEVSKFYIIYPGTSIIQEYCEIKNVTSSAIKISMPGIFDREFSNINENNSSFYYMTGNGNFSGASMLKGNSLNGGYSRVFDSYLDEIECQEVHGFYQYNIANKIMGAGVYNLFFALHDSNTQNGVFMLWDYIGRWRCDVDYSNSELSLDCSVHMDGMSLDSKGVITTPLNIVGFWNGDLDDMGNTLGEYQAIYKWDYTNDEARVNRSIQWITGYQTDNIFMHAQNARYIGSGTVHIDDSWFDKSGDWNSAFGDDFKAINEFVKKSGGSGMTIWSPIWMCNYRAEMLEGTENWIVDDFDCGGSVTTNGGYGSHLNFANEEVYQWALEKLSSMQDQWGSYMWRYDAEAVSIVDGSFNDMLAQSNNYYRLLKEFKDLNPEATIHGCSSGGHSLSIESMRYSDINQMTDGGVGIVGSYYLSMLFPAYKLQSGVRWYQSPWERANLAYTDTAGPWDPWQTIPDGGWSDAELEFSREYNEMYRFLTSEEVRSRYSKYYRPLGNMNGQVVGKEIFFEQLNYERTKGVIYITQCDELVGKTFTIYPKGLVEDCVYTVSSWEGKVQKVTKTGKELMRDGVTINGMVPGETIFFNLENRPGNGSDTTAPTAPSGLTVTESTYLGRTGIELNWNPATDDGMLSYYAIYRNGKLISKASIGTFEFTLEGSVKDEWSVSAVDADGNESAKAYSSGVINNNLYGSSYDFTPDLNTGWSYYEVVGDSRIEMTWDEESGMFVGADGSYVAKDSINVSGNSILLEWTATKSGYVNIRNTAAKKWHYQDGDGVDITVKQNYLQIFGEYLSKDNIDGLLFADYRYVNKGDKFTFEFSPKITAIGDKFYYKAEIEYTSEGAKIYPESIEIVDDKIIIAKGGTLDVSVNMLPLNTTESGLKYRIISGNDVISVNESGKVTAIKVGKAILEIQSAANSQLVDRVEIEVYDSALRFSTEQDFSSIQGYNHWSYEGFKNNNPLSSVELNWDALNGKFAGCEQYVEIKAETLHPGNNYSAAKVFSVPYDGKVKISSLVKKTGGLQGNGVCYQIYLIRGNSSEMIYMEYVLDRYNHYFFDELDVNKGDKIYFAVNSRNGNNAYDETGVYASVEYVEVTGDIETKQDVVQIVSSVEDGNIRVGEAVKLDVLLNGTLVNSGVKWTILSGNTVIGFDTKSQTLLALNSGIALIQAQAGNGGSDTYLINVYERSVNSISSSAGYSLVQGQNGWNYLSYSVSNKQYSHLSSKSEGSWAGESWVRVGEKTMHPQIGYDAVRAYKVTKTGHVNLTGHIAKNVEYLSGDGVKAKIYINETLIYEYVISSSDSIGTIYNISANVKIGDTIYLHLNSNGSDGYDLTNWEHFTNYEKSELTNDVAKGLQKRVSALPDISEISLDYLKEVNSLVESVNSLSAQDRDNMNGIFELYEIQKYLQDLEESMKRVDMINGYIQQIKKTPTNRTLINLTRSGYDTLSEDQKALIVDYQVLLDAEAAISK